MNRFQYNIAGFPVEIETSISFSPFDRLSGFEVFKTDKEETPVLSYSTIGSLDEMQE